MPLRDRVRQCNDAMPPGVKCARGTMLSLSLSLSGEPKTSPPLVHRGTNWFRKRDAVFCLLCLRPRCPACSSPISPPPHSLSHTPERSRSSLSLEPGPLVLFFGFSISAKNLCQPTCWHVFKRYGRASSRGKKRGGNLGGGLEVGLLVCSVGFRRVPRRERRGIAQRGTHTTRCNVGERTRICIYTRDTHAQPSHESKLFVTGGGGQGQKEGGHTCLLTISGRSCRGSYRVALIRDMNLILLWRESVGYLRIAPSFPRGKGGEARKERERAIRRTMMRRDRTGRPILMYRLTFWKCCAREKRQRRVIVRLENVWSTWNLETI